MQPSAARILLTIISIVCVYVVMLARQFITAFFSISSITNNAKGMDWLQGVPAPTRFAIEYGWVFAVIIPLICLFSFVWIWLHPSRIYQCFSVTLFLVGLIVWTSLFFDCYTGFHDLMHTYRDPEFDSGQFMTFCSGFFPVTFVALLIGAFVASTGRKDLQ